MEVKKTSLEGCLVIEPRIFGDERGFFTETFQVLNLNNQGDFMTMTDSSGNVIIEFDIRAIVRKLNLLLIINQLKCKNYYF